MSSLIEEPFDIPANRLKFSNILKMTAVTFEDGGIAPAKKKVPL